MKSIFLKLISASVLFISSFNASSEWQFLTKTDDGDRIYIESSMIKTGRGFASIWMLDQFSVVRNGAYSHVSLIEYDCENIRMRILKSNLFSGRMGGGSKISSSDEDLIWSYFEPSSISHYVFIRICK